MNRRQPFAKIVDSLRADNMERLKDRAFRANRISKIVAGPSRRTAYRVKALAISEMIRRGDVRILSIAFEKEGTVVGLRFLDGGMLHTIPEELLPGAKALLIEQVLSHLKG